MWVGRRTGTAHEISHGWIGVEAPGGQLITCGVHGSSGSLVTSASNERHGHLLSIPYRNSRQSVGVGVGVGVGVAMSRSSDQDKA